MEEKIEIGDLVYSPYSDATIIVDEEDDLTYINEHYTLIKKGGNNDT